MGYGSNWGGRPRGSGWKGFDCGMALDCQRIDEMGKQGMLPCILPSFKPLCSRDRIQGKTWGRVPWFPIHPSVTAVPRGQT
jgi:hypothetical protein